MDRLDNPEIHTRIERLRTDLGMTQPEFATALGMDPKKGRSTINNWETRANKIKDDDLKHIAETFHVSADWLLGLTSISRPDSSQQAIERYTGLNPEAVKRLSWAGMPDKREALNRLLSAEGFPSLIDALKSIEARIRNAEAILKYTGLSGKNRESSLNYAKESLEASVFRFAVEASNLSKSIYNVIELEKELDKAIEEAQHGEHTES